LAFSAAFFLSCSFFSWAAFSSAALSFAALSSNEVLCDVSSTLVESDFQICFGSDFQSCFDSYFMLIAILIFYKSMEISNCTNSELLGDDYLMIYLKRLIMRNKIQ
jgi:hypothetical protein